MVGQGAVAKEGTVKLHDLEKRKDEQTWLPSKEAESAVTPSENRMKPKIQGEKVQPIQDVETTKQQMMLWDIWHQDKAVAMNATLLYESAHQFHKSTAEIIGRQTLRLMG